MGRYVKVKKRIAGVEKVLLTVYVPASLVKWVRAESVKKPYGSVSAVVGEALAALAISRQGAK